MLFVLLDIAEPLQSPSFLAMGFSLVLIEIVLFHFIWAWNFHNLEIFCEHEVSGQI